MSKLALAVAVIALGLGGYAAFGTPAEAGPEPASAEALKALGEDVASLRTALAAETRAREDAAGRIEQLEGTIAQQARADAAARKTLEEEIAVLGGKKPEAEAHVETRALSILGPKGTPVLRLSASTDGGGLIEVFAKNGKRVARLFARPDDDGELELCDEHGALRANLGGNDDGGYANFYRGEETLAAYIGSDAGKESGYIAVYGTGKKVLAGLYGNKKGGVISARNLATGKQIVMIGAAPNNGMGFVGLGTDAGKAAVAHFVTRNGGQIKTLNAEGETATFMGVSASPAGNGLSYICRKNGKRIYECGTTEQGGGYLSLHNSKEKRVMFLGASSGDAPDDGVLEVARANGKLGVVLRGYSGGSSVRVYNANEKVKVNLR